MSTTLAPPRPYWPGRSAHADVSFGRQSRGGAFCSCASGVTVRESCGCGAGIQAWRKRDVIAWRTNHRHDNDEPEPQRQGAFTNSELSGPYFNYDGDRYIPQIEARRIGFTPNV
jgi:hypothetical protein